MEWPIMFLLPHDLAFSSAPLSSCLPPLFCLAMELWTSRDWLHVDPYAGTGRVWMQKVSLPAVAFDWKIYSCTLTCLHGVAWSYAGSRLINGCIKTGLMYCMRKNVCCAPFFWPDTRTGDSRGKEGIVDVCECACSRDHMTTFDLCSPWCKASHITRCKGKVWTTAHSCFCPITHNGTFLQEGAQYLLYC